MPRPAGPGRPAQGRGGRRVADPRPPSRGLGWALGGFQRPGSRKAEGTDPERPLVAAARRCREPGVPRLAAGRGRQRSGTPARGGDRTSRPRFFPLQKGSTLVVKTNFCKINKIDTDTGWVKRGRRALPPPGPREARPGAARGGSGGYCRGGAGPTTPPPAEGAAAGPHPAGAVGVGAARRPRPEAPPPAPAPLCPRVTPRPRPPPPCGARPRSVRRG